MQNLLNRWHCDARSIGPSDYSASDIAADTESFKFIRSRGREAREVGRAGLSYTALGVRDNPHFGLESTFRQIQCFDIPQRTTASCYLLYRSMHHASLLAPPYHAPPPVSQSGIRQPRSAPSQPVNTSSISSRSHSHRAVHRIQAHLSYFDRINDSLDTMTT